jgi:hypothetical protein
VTRPQWPQGGLPGDGRPQLHDPAPPQWTGVPLERDPVSGRLLSGDPLGRGDKGRSSSSGPGKTALIAGGAIACVAAVVVAVVLFTGGDDEPDPSAAAAPLTSEQTTTAAPTTTTPAVETGPRDIPVNVTYAVITPPPGFAQDPQYGTVGEVLPRTWIVTGPCDGAGPCQVQHCQAAGQCGLTFVGAPQGGGYVHQFTSPVQWGAPECTGGSIENVVTWTVTGEGEDITVSGSWVETAAQVLFTGSDGRDCGLYLAEYSIASP